MAQAAQALGYDYVAITDHSPRLAMTKGLTPDRLKAQAEEIAAAQEQLPGIRILRGQEVDILKDGSLDQTDEALAQLDIVICSVHSHFDLSREAQTARMIRAISHPATTIIGHPQGRLLERRDPIQLDFEAVFAAAITHHVAMEINADPHRLDLDATAIQLGKQLGVTFTIDTDAHTPSGLTLLRYGLDEARRGWLGEGRCVEYARVGKIARGIGKVTLQRCSQEVAASPGCHSEQREESLSWSPPAAVLIGGHFSLQPL